MILALAITEFRAQIELLRLDFFSTVSQRTYLIVTGPYIKIRKYFLANARDVQNTGCESNKDGKNYDIIIVVLYLNITNFEIIKALRVTSKGVIHLLKFNFSSVCIFQTIYRPIIDKGRNDIFHSSFNQHTANHPAKEYKQVLRSPIQSSQSANQ